MLLCKNWEAKIQQDSVVVVLCGLYMPEYEILKYIILLLLIFYFVGFHEFNDVHVWNLIVHHLKLTIDLSRHPPATPSPPLDQYS